MIARYDTRHTHRFHVRPFTDRRWFWIVLVFDTARQFEAFDRQFPGKRTSAAACCYHGRKNGSSRALGLIAFYRRSFVPKNIAHESVHAAIWTIKRLTRQPIVIRDHEERLATVTGWIAGKILAVLAGN